MQQIKTGFSVEQKKNCENQSISVPTASVELCPKGFRDSNDSGARRMEVTQRSLTEIPN